MTSEETDDLNDPGNAGLTELKQGMTRYKAPPRLERRIRHLLSQQSHALGWMDRVRTSWASWVPLGASFACGALLAVSVLVAYRGTTADDDAIERQVVAGHVRSLMAGHLTDIASTDQHTVKPWFTGKLDYAPPVVDLAQYGFPLAGGRLDYVDQRPVAALVYRRRGHTINVFVLPARNAAHTKAAPAVEQGFQLAQFEYAGMRFWAVSDISRDEMMKFAAALEAALAAG